jgi:hypothetical protein
MKTEVIKLLERRLERVQQEHVERLLAVLDEALKLIKIERRATVGDSLEHFKQATWAAQSAYGDRLREEVLLVVKEVRQAVGADEKKEILAIASKYLSGDLYDVRFRCYESAFERHIASYGVKINLADFRADLVKALYQAASLNFISSTRAKLADDLELLVLRASRDSAAPEGKFEQANRFIKLEPNIFGLGFNLNYLIRRLFGRKE